MTVRMQRCKARRTGDSDFDLIKENWERKLFYLLTKALMGDPLELSNRGVIRAL